MEQVTIVVSDLHLGAADELEDFVPENQDAFVRFLKQQSADHKSKKIDLVILGDFVDIWQVATEREKHAQNSKDISTAINIDWEIKRTREIVEKHSATFSTLRSFLETNPDRFRIIIVAGNHDHSLIHADVKEVVRHAISGDDASLRKQINFHTYYDEPKLGIYAEHGNQFDENNDYTDYNVFGAEAPGYYFVRLFWNRLEMLQPNLDNWMNSFSAIFKQRLWGLLYPAYELFQQYYFDDRPFKRIKLVSIPSVFFEGTSVGVPELEVSLKEFPDLLFTQRDVAGRIFSTDNRLEQKLLNLYNDPQNYGFTKAVDKILDEKYQSKPPKVPLDNNKMLELEFLEQDACISAVRGMFAARNGTARFRPLKGGILSPEVYKFVILGHTHEEKTEDLSDLNVTYFNTGSWSLHSDDEGNNVSRYCYVTIQRSSSGHIEASQSIWE